MTSRIEPGEIERRFARAAKLRAEVERKERAIARQVQGLAQSLAELMQVGDHHHRRGVGIHGRSSRIGGSTASAANLIPMRDRETGDQRDLLESLGREVYGDDFAGFLATPRRSLGGETPAALIERGDLDPVIRS